MFHSINCLSSIIIIIIIIINYTMKIVFFWIGNSLLILLF